MQIQTRFGTYDCIQLPEWLHPTLDDAPKMSCLVPRPVSCRPPPWSDLRQAQLDRVDLIFPIRSRTFQTLIREIHLPTALRSAWMSEVHPDHQIVLQLGGLIYDLCRTTPQEGETGLQHVYRQVKNYAWADWISPDEWRLLWTITRFYHETTGPPRELARTIINRAIISPVQLHRILQAILVAHRGVDFFYRFKTVGWHLHLILGGIELPAQVSRRVEIYRLSSDVGSPSQKKLQVVPLTEKNLLTLLEDPVSSFARPIEFSRYEYLRATGRTKVELRRELFDLLPEPVLVGSARQEIRDWYQTSEPNKLSRRSLEDLTRRLSKYPRDGWDPDRIMMRARGLSSIQYRLENFIDEYDQEWVETSLNQKRRWLQEQLAPLYPRADLEDLTEEEAFQIPVLSPRGLLLIYRILKGRVPIWFDRLLAHSVRSVVTTRPEFPGLYGERYGIDGLIITGLDDIDLCLSRVVLVRS